MAAEPRPLFWEKMSAPIRELPLVEVLRASSEAILRALGGSHLTGIFTAAQRIVRRAAAVQRSTRAALRNYGPGPAIGSQGCGS